MRKRFYLLSLIFFSFYLNAQQVTFEEYDLDNGLHVILHQDNTAPLVVTSVLYHVGAKNEEDERTGFAHFFEHLLFEGTENIERGDWFKIVSSNGGRNNAYTTDDFTYYYEVFPSNNLELGLWMESERMLHPIINEVGVETQNEVVKEEKRLRYDNSPYGKWAFEVRKRMFEKHPYRHIPIGEMDHLDAATLDEFIAFNEKFYVPNNAVLVVAGDFEMEEAKKMIANYFSEIPRGEEIEVQTFEETPISEPITAEAFDKNIQVPALFTAYRIPKKTTRDSRVLDMISTYLSDGKSSKLYRKLVDEKKMSLQVAAFNMSMEDYGLYVILSLPVGSTELAAIRDEIDEEVDKIQNELISEKDYQKLLNKFESDFVSSNSSVEGIANSLAEYYAIYGDTNLINSEIDIYRSISREEIRAAAKKYLNPNQRLTLNYLPESK
ncbi:MAG: putative zinc protease [uncultured Bacteroidota bacterium]|jgi:predicted Zn-dependent peptidase|nr:MAG: putative zinc protease [uncultured Bacteroidetes bacterium]